MNKEELIAILQERSKEASLEDGKPKTANNNEHIKSFQKKQEAKSPLTKYKLFILALILALAYSVYYQIANKDNVDTTKFVAKKDLTFQDLPVSSKENYILKEQLQAFQAKLRESDKTYISKLEKDIEGLNLKLSAEKKAKAAVLNKAKSKSKRYNAIGCYDEIEGTKNINGACKDKISRFLKRNKKNALKFEIIAVLDTKDKKFINTQVNQVNASRTIKNNLKEFLTQGLARTRVLEAAWLVKNTLGEKVLISYVNYIAETQDKRGITIRAYY